MLGEAVQKHVAASDASCQQRAVTTTLASALTCHSFLKKTAAKIRINKAAFHLLHRFAQRGIRKTFPCLPSRKVPSLEDPHVQPVLVSMPVAGMFLHFRCRPIGR